VTALEDRIAAAFIAACRDELEAPKPGNVHVFDRGDGRAVADYVSSADVAAGPIARRGAAVGARILGAVEATHAAVGHNTNLGIVLLCAVLARAAELQTAQLRVGVADVLASLDLQDARLAFRAIALAAPGGLGRSERHDVFQPATATLREAMAEAAPRDRIARQYATAFDDVFNLGVPRFDAAERRWGQNQRAAALAVYLGFLAAFPDTHIQRKHGAAAAAAVQKEAEPLHARLEAAADHAALLDDVLAFDASLKRRGINPGASADLTVAVLFTRRLHGLGLPNILQSARNND